MTTSMRPMSQRQQRIAGQIRDVVAQVLSRGEANHPELNGLINITRVWISKDIRHATVFFTALDNRDPNVLEEAFDESSYIFARALGKSMTSKYTAKLKFQFDDGHEYSNDLGEKLDHLNVKPESDFEDDENPA